MSQRRAERVEVPEAVTVEIDGHRGRLVDLSASGCGAELGRTLARGRTVHAAAIVGKVRHAFVATVCWSRTVEGKARVGLRFLRVEAGMMALGTQAAR
jgi:c-di-GMP-binding flagellar brake protein YcgR